MKKDFAEVTPASGSGNQVVTVTVPANTGAARSITLDVRTGGGATRQVVIEQALGKAEFDCSIGVGLYNKFTEDRMEAPESTMLSIYTNTRPITEEILSNAVAKVINIDFPIVSMEANTFRSNQDIRGTIRYEILANDNYTGPRISYNSISHQPDAAIGEYTLYCKNGRLVVEFNLDDYIDFQDDAIVEYTVTDPANGNSFSGSFAFMFMYSPN